ncbi:zinc finger and SCAN domain-containing protein 16-like [Myxocyprinus asiaticus]|uniref:zinc finger and SCAN domain-containing protein 16-like n=1 Tax=Myxocyprinus asiaticus TaxID=70543 RepID=UPI00222168DB|nr:zinc finger and SCAN domain-containing protein 16-like [Myxocyprinus asiaticus]
MQRVGRSPEQSCQHFRSLKLEKNGCPFAFTHQLWDACWKWLLAGEPRGTQDIVDEVVLEQFISQLPHGMAKWVECHRLASLEEAVQLAEGFMKVGEPSPVVAGPVCWSCGEPGCPVMEVGTLVRIPDSPQAAPDRAGAYRIFYPWG